MACVAVTRVTVHLVDTVAISACIGLTVINVSADLFSAHYFHLETRGTVTTVIHVPIDETSGRTATA